MEIKYSYILIVLLIAIIIIFFGTTNIVFAQDENNLNENVVIDVVLEEAPEEADLLVALIFMNPEVMDVKEMLPFNETGVKAEFIFPPEDDSVPSNTVTPSQEFMACVMHLSDNEHLIANCKMAKELDEPHEETVTFKTFSDDGNQTAALRYTEPFT